MTRDDPRLAESATVAALPPAVAEPELARASGSGDEGRREERVRARRGGGPPAPVRASFCMRIAPTNAADGPDEHEPEADADGRTRPCRRAGTPTPRIAAKNVTARINAFQPKPSTPFGRVVEVRERAERDEHRRDGSEDRDQRRDREQARSSRRSRRRSASDVQLQNGRNEKISATPPPAMTTISPGRWLRCSQRDLRREEWCRPGTARSAHHGSAGDCKNRGNPPGVARAAAR